jgi:hypothetical protein
LQTLVQKFFDRLKARENVSDGLVKQAHDAIQLYLYHCEDGIRFGQAGYPPLSSATYILTDMKRLIRVKHYYSCSTEQAYHSPDERGEHQGDTRPAWS